MLTAEQSEMLGLSLTLHLVPACLAPALQADTVCPVLRVDRPGQPSEGFCLRREFCRDSFPRVPFSGHERSLSSPRGQDGLGEPRRLPCSQPAPSPNPKLQPTSSVGLWRRQARGLWTGSHQEGCDSDFALPGPIPWDRRRARDVDYLVPKGNVPGGRPSQLVHHHADGQHVGVGGAR